MATQKKTAKNKAKEYKKLYPGVPDDMLQAAADLEPHEVDALAKVGRIRYLYAPSDLALQAFMNMGEAVPIVTPKDKEL